MIKNPNTLPLGTAETKKNSGLRFLRNLSPAESKEDSGLETPQWLQRMWLKARGHSGLS